MGSEKWNYTWKQRNKLCTLSFCEKMCNAESGERENTSHNALHMQREVNGTKCKSKSGCAGEHLMVLKLNSADEQRDLTGENIERDRS